MGQLLSNLIGDAVTHGSADQPIRVFATVNQVSVSNGGAPIPDSARAELLYPFSRGEAGSSLQGLGLGLHIASRIAEAHNGRISVSSDENETRFTFSMPVTPCGAVAPFYPRYCLALPIEDPHDHPARALNCATNCRVRRFI